MASVASGGYKTILENLCHLEINTIVKDNMTGQKMPVPEIAIADLAEEYVEYLATLDRHLAAEPVGPGRFKAIHDAAVAILADLLAATPEHKSDKYWMVARIRDSCSQLLTLLEAVGVRNKTPVVDYMRADAAQHQLELLADEVVVVRKAWELGLEEIALQTFIQLDGDVVHRVKQQYATGDHAQLLTIHQSAVNTSIGYWKTLIEVIGDLVGGVIRIFGLKT